MLIDDTGKDVGIIAVDFDGTLSFAGWPFCGNPNERLIEYLKRRRADGDKLILWTNRAGRLLDEAVAWCAEQGLEFDAVNENLPELVAHFQNDSRKIGADIYIDDKCKHPTQLAEWMEDEDGIYYCSQCGMPASWGYPTLQIQRLSRFCDSCGALMRNERVGCDTPHEEIKAEWIQKKKGAHQYFCSVCGGKESSPRIWCPRCGCRMDKDGWKKRWHVREAWKKQRDKWKDPFIFPDKEAATCEK